MYMRNILTVGLTTILSVRIGTLWAGDTADRQERTHSYGLGRPTTAQEIQAWNIDVAPTSEGLPPGRGTVKEGAACHGPTGQEGPMDRLVGGEGSLASPQPIKAIGSYWPYATTLYDYVHRAMPFPAPRSLSPNEIHSVVAWLLYRNGIIVEDFVLHARSLPGISMPNRQGFFPDPRPDVR